MADSMPPSASAKYKTLHATAVTFIHSADRDESLPKRFSEERIKAIRSASGFQHSCGHKGFVEATPQLAGTHDADAFIKHLEMMVPKLDSWDTTISDIFIDEHQNSVVVRASHAMGVKGTETPIEHDIVWFLTMEPDGKTVKKSIEFLDPIAGQQIREAMSRQE
ncbi:hypothetical protein BU24DRAFT_263108 [Aaosphaeria arxii CBS 175.79]|uniref:SnoaL-like domain-containing protein n=1 Tax=Aaosphaeria arxii CBS 175.79 TaxID=1450172 RepID=A0A6A5XL75_9PLEO|nr:uncharacterized protein BU24DRAFT_263108 [Aaosphaeria arxii CBS 175.79]KAF2013044.1 hypothetical protein BU24DRAFT_263108 [Aaosphaeria arxii CBS 175.79]